MSCCELIIALIILKIWILTQNKQGYIFYFIKFLEKITVEAAICEYLGPIGQDAAVKQGPSWGSWGGGWGYIQIYFGVFLRALGLYDPMPEKTIK